MLIRRKATSISEHYALIHLCKRLTKKSKCIKYLDMKCRVFSVNLVNGFLFGENNIAFQRVRS